MKTSSPFLARLVQPKPVQASVLIEFTTEQSKFLVRAAKKTTASKTKKK